MRRRKITELSAVQGPLVAHARSVGWNELTKEEALALRGGSEEELFLEPRLRLHLALFQAPAVPAPKRMPNPNWFVFVSPWMVKPSIVTLLAVTEALPAVLQPSWVSIDSSCSRIRNSSSTTKTLRPLTLSALIAMKPARIAPPK